MALHWADLRKNFKGEIHTDQVTKILYATDASAYREIPLGVVFPSDEKDIAALIRFAHDYRVTLIPRTAGTSLAGQVVGRGIIVDVSRTFTRILEVNPEESWVRLEPAVVRDELNMHLKPFGLYYGPETSTANRAMIGGMVGNNSCGSNSVVYGSARDHLLEVSGYLSDGSFVTFKDISRAGFIHKIRTILNTSLPAIARDFGESSLNMQNAIIAYVLTLAVFMPVSGFLADKYGTKRVFIFAVILFATGSLLCGFSRNLTHLVIARIIQGVGGSLMTPVAKLALIRTFPKKELIRAMNYAIVPALIGPILGPLVGGYMVDYLSWHWIFLINVPISVAGLFMSLRYLPDYRSQVIDFDMKGFLIFAGASLLLSVAVELFSEAHNVTPVLLMLVIGFILIFFYFRHSHTDNNPIFPFSLFQVRTFRLGILGNLATRLGISSVSLLVPLMIQIAYGKSAVVSGWLIAPMAFTAIFGKSFVIPILNRYGYRKTLMVNTAVIGLIICLFAIPGSGVSVVWFLPLVAALGFFNSILFLSRIWLNSMINSGRSCTSTAVSSITATAFSSPGRLDKRPRPALRSDQILFTSGPITSGKS
jgi:EmrB/QacA subfamily drug resistance transporter